jgi:hypothetical protein
VHKVALQLGDQTIAAQEAFQGSPILWQTSLLPTCALLLLLLCPNRAQFRYV